MRKPSHASHLDANGATPAGRTRRIAAAMRARRGSAFIPFFTVGDPDLATTRALVREAARQGADLIELGVPFSDPIADGPVIQASYFRALKRGFKVADLFRLARGLRRVGLQTPLIAMVSHSLVFKRGLDRFFHAAKQAGLDGLIIPDLPAGYEGSAARRAAALGLDLIFLCAPTTAPARRARIARTARGFVYYISVAGVTGARRGLPADLRRNLADLRRRTRTPVCVGFGISDPRQAAQVGRWADGVIVGSALVRRVGDLLASGASRGQLIRSVGAEVGRLASAAHSVSSGRGRKRHG